ncbi:MAG: phage recombination protein Bet [Oscillospiraceae bacterium]|nr:phage recombination protein Bet [Oscillospiraceae bacterium]
MALNNRIAQRQQQSDKVIEYKCGEETVKLSPSIIRNYLVSGSGNVTDQEVAMFLNLCRFQHLNPFLREAYLIKFGNQPATIVTGKEAITKRAMRNPKYEGQQAGVVIFHNESGELEYRPGSLIMDGEQLVGGWAKVYVKDYKVPIEAVVSYQEYVGTTKDGVVNSQWSKKPATMIRKVALTQALREAFPEDLGGLYASEEMGLDFDETAMAPVEIEQPQAEIEAAPEQATMEDIPNF